MSLGKSVLQHNLGLRHGERVVIVTDPAMKDREALVWLKAARQLTDQVELLVVAGMTHSGQEPPSEIVEACRCADVVILHTHYSLTHTQAGKAGRENGGRVSSLPGVTLDMMRRTLTIDYDPIKELGDKLANKLRTGKELTITSPTGTNLRCDIRTNLVINDGGIIDPGEIGNLPAGEVFFAPLEGTTEGTWVVNGALADDKLQKPVKIIIENGIAIKIEGDEVADRLRKKLAKVGPKAFVVAEIGLGTNRAVNPHGEIIEAEKAYGTAHLALGNNVGFGGTNIAPIHLDGLTLEPTVRVDGNLIIDKGNILA